jgi:hypothetical protein
MTQTDTDDLINLLCGKQLGAGQYRTVFQCAIDPERVIKHDNGDNFSNINEWQIFSEFEGTPLEQWIAPVFWLSPRGLWLIQAKTTPIAAGQLPKKVPAIFADTKPDNWGMYKGRPVCHDYGNHNLYNLARRSALVLKRPDWD